MLLSATRAVALGLALLTVAGCATSRVSSGTAAAPAELVFRAGTEIPEEQLVDVWIEFFDPGELPKRDKDALGLSMDIRNAEAHYMPVRLRRTLEKTGYWGAVRVVPRGTEGAELLIAGKILDSDGETLELQIEVTDARGERWFHRKYEQKVELAAYRTPGNEQADLFQPIYNTIANDLAAHRSKLTTADVTEIRRLAELRFATDLAPEAFGRHIARDGEGHYSVTRLPARDDPMYQRVQAIRERDFVLVDTLSGHADNFYRAMHQPYREWRKARAAESEALRQVNRQATKRKLLGAAAIAGAIGIEILGGGGGATRTLRDVMIVGGVYTVKRGFDIGADAEIHADAVEELGASFSTEARPLVVEVDGQTHELTGSAEAQYAKWRGLLRDIYSAETGPIGVVD